MSIQSVHFGARLVIVALLDSAGFTLDRIVPSPSMFPFTEAALR
jgi:hypothetical protein